MKVHSINKVATTFPKHIEVHYFNNAATTFPKPKEVYDAMMNYMVSGGFSSDRGSGTTKSASNILFSTRELFTKFFNADSPNHVIFGMNATDGLNIGIHGYLREGCHVIISQLEHTSVLRPLKYEEEKRGVEVTIIKCSKEGFLDPKDVEDAIQDNTRMICMLHASNVTGTILPIREIGKIARKKGIIFLVDCTQSAGILPIDMKQDNIDMLAFTGHKSLFGPQGTGGLVIREGLEVEIEPVKQGGSGTKSDLLIQRELDLPDRFECGTRNIVGIAGLKAGLEFIIKTGIEKIKIYDENLIEYMLKRLSELEGVTVYGSKDCKKQVAVISINLEGFSPSDVGFILDTSFNLITRDGLHCAPLAHECIGSLPLGTLRLSMSYFNTKEQIDYLIDSLGMIVDNGG